MLGLALLMEDVVHAHITSTRGSTHNEKGPAIEYADGLKVYSFNGTVIPEKWVMERDTIDPSEINKLSFFSSLVVPGDKVQIV